MISSAKTTAISFLAVAALGAAAIVGCTVDSSTVDDTDGGTITGDGNPDSGTTTDTDSGDTTPATCESKQTVKLTPASCQSCVEAKCCTQLQGCFNLPSDADAGLVDCNGYAECIDNCNAGAPADAEQCYGVCDTTTSAEVKAAYEALTQCQDTSCATDCGGETPDGG